MKITDLNLNYIIETNVLGEISNKQLMNYIPRANKSRDDATDDMHKTGYNPKVVDKMERRADFTMKAQHRLHNKGEVDEAKGMDNFTADDINALNTMDDLNAIKAKAKALISTPSKRPMAPEKVEWFKQAINGMTNKNNIIKLMYDLLLSGEGNSVLGTRYSMSSNSYRKRFGEEMGGINQCAPSNDVSFEDVLNDVYDKWHGQKTKVTELDKSKYRDWADASRAWRSKQPNDMQDPTIVAKAERRAGKEMDIMYKHGRKDAKTRHSPVNESFGERLKKYLKD